eukprot:240344_1
MASSYSAIAREKYGASLSIYVTVLLTTTSPILAYGLWKLHQFRDHILIQKRFPMISYSIILLTFTNTLVHTSKMWHLQRTDQIAENRLGAALAIFVYGLINIRLCLIYLRWTEHENVTKSRERHLNYTLQGHNLISTSVTEYIRNKLRNNTYFHCSVLSIFIFTVCAFLLFVLTYDFNATMMAICWTIQLVISIVLAIIVSVAKVKEGIGCMQEAIILLVLSVAVSCLTPLLSLSVQSAAFFLFITPATPCITGLVPIIVPLYHIYKMEGTLNASREEKYLNVINTDDPLFVFLEVYDNYVLYEEYLSYCWAVENLLFYQKICILYQVMLKYSSVDVSNSNDSKEVVHRNTVHRNRLEYLTAIYEHYEGRIQKHKKPMNTLSFEDLRPIFHRMQNEIYEEFVEDGAMHQINISYTTQKHLAFVLREDKENMDKFQTFDDFLHLYDSAIREIFQLLTSMYTYRFKAFVEAKAK